MQLYIRFINTPKDIRVDPPSCNARISTYSTCAYIRIHKNDVIFVGAFDTNDTGTLLAMASTVPSISSMSTVHCPLSTVHPPRLMELRTVPGTLLSLVLLYCATRYSTRVFKYTIGHPFGHLHKASITDDEPKTHRLHSKRFRCLSAPSVF
jgi:hypothetical protein